MPGDVVEPGVVEFEDFACGQEVGVDAGAELWGKYEEKTGFVVWIVVWNEVFSVVRGINTESMVSQVLLMTCSGSGKPHVHELHLHGWIWHSVSHIHRDRDMACR